MRPRLLPCAFVVLVVPAGCAPTGGPVRPETGGVEEIPSPDEDPPEEVGSACDDASWPRGVISEVLASNLAGLLDADGDTSDWIEVANLDGAPLELVGWGLSAEADGGRPWRLPSRVLGPGEVLLVFASGKDRTDDELHTDFTVEGEAPHAVLLAPDGCAVDQAHPDRLYGDVSYGRTAAAPDTWGYFLAPTPGAANATESRPGFAPVPTFDPPGGFVDGEVTVTVPDGVGVVRVTWDGAEPTEESPSVDGALDVDATSAPVVVRARVFQDGRWPSRVATATFLPEDVLAYGLDVVSLVVDPDDLWNEETGIYVYGPPDYTPYYPYFGANFWEDWERPVHMTVWDADGVQVVDQDAGIKIHGGYTRAFAQKSLRVNPRTAYGPATLDHRFFPKEDIDEWQNIVLEGAGDWCPTHTENAFQDEVFRDDAGVRAPTVETQAWEPCVVYLNGAFWGLYAFREQQDEAYAAAHFGVDPDNLDRMECTADGTDDWWKLQQGTWDAFDEMNAFVSDHDLSDPAAWETFRGMASVENLASTVLVEAYMANADWWYNNLRLWRERVEPGPFHWVTFDLGHGWASYTYDHIATSVTWTGPGLPIADALENDAFRVELANQAAELLATRLAPDRAVPVLDGMHARIEPVIADQYALWCGQPESTWESSVAYAREFAQRRPGQLRLQVGRALGLGSTVDLTLEADPPGAGTFRLTLVEVTPPATLPLYPGIPVRVTALPAEGWAFSGWSSGADEETVELTLEEATTLVATFD